eukprot:TRINITY_DN23858_c0_g1_i2.p1 TRINITY_DN23858_c0_g1~~TRINITY_DN23858_c0_g1_i2.p1  ORF type:complete len:1012 (-),score=210.72 TRINITY_DN23858_c0_g1_i2:199-2880(-)
MADVKAHQAAAHAVGADQKSRKPETSKALFTLFSEWDAKRPTDSASGASSSGEGPYKLPQNSMSVEVPLSIFKENIKEIRAYQAALLQQPQRSIRKKVTSLLWRVFYRVIRDSAAEIKQLRDRRRKQHGNAPVEKQDIRTLEGNLAAALSEAETSIQAIFSRIHRKVRSVDPSTVSLESPSKTSDSSGARFKARLQLLAQLNTMLADIERYRATSGIGDVQEALARAERLYRAALEACPELGQAFNQRGLLAAQRGDRLKAVRYGFHALLCSLPFPNSKDNLVIWLGQLANEERGGEEPGRADSVILSLRRSAFQASPQSCAEAAICAFQKMLLEMYGRKAFPPGMSPSFLDELIGRAQDRLRESLAATSGNYKQGSGTLDWLLEVLMVSVCAALYYKNSMREQTAADWIRIGSRAWDWIVRFGLCLTDEVESCGRASLDSESCLLTPLALLGMLASLLLPELWRGTDAAPLREAIGQLQHLGPQSFGQEDARLLQFALPEDSLASGILKLPLVTAATSDAARNSIIQTALARPPPVPEGDEEFSEDEVVLCSPLVQAAEFSREPLKRPSAAVTSFEITGNVSKPAAAPSHLQDDVRRARLRFCLWGVMVSGALPQNTDPEDWPWEEEDGDEILMDREPGETLGELDEEPDLWDMPDGPADPSDDWPCSALPNDWPMRDDWQPGPQAQKDLSRQDWSGQDAWQMHDSWSHTAGNTASGETVSESEGLVKALLADGFSLGGGGTEASTKSAKDSFHGLPADVASVAAACAASAAAAAVAAWTPPPGFAGSEDASAIQQKVAMCAAALASEAFGNIPQTSVTNGSSMPAQPCAPRMIRAPPGLVEDGCAPPLLDFGFLDEDAAGDNIEVGLKNLPPPPDCAPPLPPPPGLTLPHM